MIPPLLSVMDPILLYLIPNLKYLLFYGCHPQIVDTDHFFNIS